MVGDPHHAQRRFRDELRYRKRIAALHDQVRAAEDEESLLRLVREHNEVVRRLNTMGTNAIRSTLGPLDETVELRRLSERRRFQANVE